MSSLAEVVHRHGDNYLAQYGHQLLPSQRRALSDIVHCRTAACGGHIYHCADCNETHYQYHSCKNRHCPQCQHQQGQDWLERQGAMRLPVPYFMVTFTLPAELHRVAMLNQKVIYNILFRSSAAALQKLARDPRYVGGKIGMVGVLHTWGRNLSYHPHVHYLVPAGGVSVDGRTWLEVKNNFLVPVKALSVLYCAKFRDALKQTDLFDQVPASVWQRDWVTHCQPVGRGEGAMRYLAPYVFRVAISNRRILKVTDEHVTFRYRASDTGRWHTSRVTGVEFLRRFLQHVLPKGFVKVRYYGLFSPGMRQRLAVVRLMLALLIGLVEPEEAQVDHESAGFEVRCPQCGEVMRWVQRFDPYSRSPPAC